MYEIDNFVAQEEFNINVWIRKHHQPKTIVWYRIIHVSLYELIIWIISAVLLTIAKSWEEDTSKMWWHVLQ